MKSPHRHSQIRRGGRCAVMSYKLRDFSRSARKGFVAQYQRNVTNAIPRERLHSSQRGPVDINAIFAAKRATHLDGLTSQFRN